MNDNPQSGLILPGTPAPAPPAVDTDDLAKRTAALTEGLGAIVRGLSVADALDVWSYAMAQVLRGKTTTREGRRASMVAFTQRLGQAVDMLQEQEEEAARVLKAVTPAGQA